MFAGGLHRGRGLWVLLVLVILGGLVAGCTSFFNKFASPDELSRQLNSGVPAKTLKPLTAGSTSCVSAIVEPERSQLLQDALADPQLQAVRTQLENRGLQMNSELAIAKQVGDGQQLLIPFGDQAHLVWQSHQGQTLAFGLIQQGNKTLNLSATGEERTVRELTPDQAKKLLKKLRGKNKFKDFEKQLKHKGKHLADERIHILFDETRGVAAIGLVTADSAGGNFTHQLRVALKKAKDDELENGADPTVQETSCSQVSAQAKLPKSAPSNFQVKPMTTVDGEPVVGGSSGGDICTSTWGYQYSCYSTTPQFNLASSGSAMVVFVGQTAQTSITIDNSGGGHLTGTATVTAPFSIVSGASYDLLPGQPGTIVVKFSLTAAGSFTTNVHMVAGSLMQDVPVDGWTLSVSPAQLSFGAFVGSYLDQAVSVTNNAPPTWTDAGGHAVAVTTSFTASTSAPYGIGSATSNTYTLAGGASQSVTIRFSPTTTATASGTVHLVSASNSAMDLQLTGTPYQVSLNPAQPTLSALVSGTTQQAVTLTNSSAASITLTASTSAPFSIVSPTAAVTVASGGTLVITVQYSPTTSGTSSANLHLVSGPNSSKDFPITGNAYQLTVSPAQPAFTGVLVNGSATQVVTVTNTSTISMSLTASMNAPFSVVSPTTVVILPPNGSQNFTIQFSPTTSGSSSGILHLVVGGSLTRDIAVTGWTVTVSPASLTFTGFADGSQDLTVIVKNDDPNSSDTMLVPVTLSTSAPYSVIGASSYSFGAQQSHQMTIRFAPTAAGTFTGSAHVVGGASSLDLPLTGAAYQLSLSPAQPNVSAFVNASGQQVFTLTNASSVPVTLTVSIDAPFSLVSPTGVITLGANQSTDFTVQFSPTAAGSFTGNLHLVSSASANKDFVITGTAQAISLSAADLVFPGTFVNSSAQQHLTVTNTGSTQASFNASAGGSFSVVSPTGTINLAPNQNVDLVVEFHPTTAGTYAKNVTLTSGSSVQNVPVTGWTLSLSPAQLDPYTAFIGNPAPQQTLVVTNDGPEPTSVDAVNLGKRGATTAKLLSQAAQFNVSSITALTAAGTPAYSVDPTSCSLYGQHSCQLTVKFIPTESGNFSGGIGLTSANGGISSSSNLGVNGTAYKISVNPVWNSFGLVFIDPTGEIPPTVRESIITLTNLGTTAITLQFDRSAPPANSPFAVIGPGQNPMVLAPTSTVKFRVQFSPTDSGFYSETIKIVVGNEVPGIPESPESNAATFYIPFEGLAMTVEEYIQKLKDSEASGDLEAADLFAGDPSSDTGILYAGMLDGLNLQRMRLIEQMYTNPQSDADAAEQWKQIEKGIAIFQSIDPNAIQGWVSTLRNALENGGQVAYQAAHDQLFSSDDEYVKYIAAMLLMQGRISLPPEIQLGDAQLAKLIKDFLVQFFAGLAGSVVSARLQDPSFHCAADEATCNLEYNLLVFWRDTLHYAFNQEKFDELKRNWDFLLTNAVTLLNGQELKAISYAIFRIGQSIVTFVQVHITCLNNDIINCNPGLAISSVANYLLWAVNMSLPGLPGSSVDPQIRMQEVVGTLLALGVLAMKGWHMHGIATDHNGWWGGLAYLPNSPGDGTPNYNKSIVLVVRGDHCTDCAAQANAIVKWVFYALQYIQSTNFKVMYNEWGGPQQPIITICFTNTNATGIASVLVSLQFFTLQAWNPENVPIVVMWFEKDANGNWGVQIRCIGSKCKELEDGGVIKKMQDDYFWALQQALKAYPGQSPDSAWWLNYGACGGDADCIKFIAEQTARWLNGEIGPPPEPECGPNGCEPVHH